MKKLLLLLFYIAWISGFMEIYGQTFEIEIYVAKYKDNKEGAISYTFDDGLAEHYTLVFPEFEKRGFKATFWINGSKINEDPANITDTARMTWKQLKEMSDHGHEISNHGWAHVNFGRHEIDQIKEDIFKGDSCIFVNIGIMPVTFCYPNNSKPQDKIHLATEGRVGTRTKQTSIGSKTTPESLNKWVMDIIENKDWGVGMTHGMTYGYDAFVDTQRFWDHLDIVKQLEDKIWVGTFKEIAAYEKERDNIELNIERRGKNFTVIPSLNLDKKTFR